MAENSTLHANFTALSSIEPGLLPIKVLNYGREILHSFAFVRDIDLDPMTFIYDLDPYPFNM